MTTLHNSAARAKPEAPFSGAMLVRSPLGLVAHFGRRLVTHRRTVRRLGFNRLNIFGMPFSGKRDCRAWSRRGPGRRDQLPWGIRCHPTTTRSKNKPCRFSSRRARVRKPEPATRYICCCFWTTTPRQSASHCIPCPRSLAAIRPPISSWKAIPYPAAIAGWSFWTASRD